MTDDGPSDIHARHVRVAVACGNSLRRGGGDLGEVVFRQLDVDGGGVFFEMRDLAAAGDGDDVGPLGEEPGEGELGGGDALFFGDLLDAFDEVEVLLEVVAGEAG